MSHFTVLVIGDDYEGQLEPFWELDLSRKDLKKDPRAVFNVKIREEDLEAEYLKFKEKCSEDKYTDIKKWVEQYHGYYYSKKDKAYGYYSNPKQKWDWYSVGGRWSGYFKLKDGAEGVLGRPGIFDNKPKPGWVDQAKKGDIDFVGMRKSFVDEQEKLYDEFHKIVNGRTVPKWNDMVKVFDEIVDEAREAYNSNPVIKDLRDAHFYDFEEFLIPKDEFLKDANQSALSTYAVLFKGNWCEKGEMGWWCMTSNEKENNDWNKEFTELLDGLPDDEILTLVDCHI